MNHQPDTPASLNEAVAEIVTFGGLDGQKEVSWRKGRMPPIGTKLYAAPGAAIDAREQQAPELLLGWKRYEKARKLSPFQWNRLHIRNLAGENFDAMIDSLPEPTTPVPTPSEALPPATVAQPVAMTPMEFDDGRKGWYVRNADFYLDIEQDANGKWSAFFLHACGGEAFADQADAAQPCASQGCGGAVSDDAFERFFYGSFRDAGFTVGGHPVSSTNARHIWDAALSTAPRSLDGATPGGNDHG